MTVMVTQTSLRISLGNSGRMGRSTTREDRMACSPGRPLTAHTKLPEYGRAAYSFSSNSTLKGEEINAVTGLVAHGNACTARRSRRSGSSGAAVGQTAHFAGSRPQGGGLQRSSQICGTWGRVSSRKQICKAIGFLPSFGMICRGADRAPRFGAIKPAAKLDAWVLDLLRKTAVAGRLFVHNKGC